jgi:phosphoribosylaminoimidazole-succinocarboxamide synthase
MIDLPLLRRGKVRDVYDLGDHVLLVATDRISAFDVVLPTAIPDKGAVLTQMSAFWFGQTEPLAPNHLVAADVDAMPAEVRRHADELRGRAMLGRKARRLDVECVARGYLAGSGWAEYRRAGTVGGQPAPAVPAGERRAARAALHADDQGRERPRPADELRRGGEPGRARAGRAGA